MAYIHLRDLLPRYEQILTANMASLRNISCSCPIVLLASVCLHSFLSMLRTLLLSAARGHTHSSTAAATAVRRLNNLVPPSTTSQPPTARLHNSPSPTMSEEGKDPPKKQEDTIFGKVTAIALLAHSLTHTYLPSIHLTAGLDSSCNLSYRSLVTRYQPR